MLVIKIVYIIQILNFNEIKYNLKYEYIDMYNFL